MSEKLFNQDQKLAIVAKLFHLRIANRIPRIWVDDFSVRIETGIGIRRPLKWNQAERLAGGEPLESVMRSENRLGKRKPAAAWIKRRREYLMRAGRSSEF